MTSPWEECGIHPVPRVIKDQYPGRARNNYERQHTSPARYTVIIEVLIPETVYEVGISRRIVR